MRLHLPLICVFLSFGVSSYGQELYSEKDRKSLYDGAFTGCLEKQGTEGLNSYLKPSVISEFCDCAATEVVGDFLGDMDFQIALSRKNVARVKLLTEKFSAPNYTMPRFQLCFGRIETKYGGLMKMIKDTIVNSPSGKIGLEGESRRSFLMSGVYNCVMQL